MIGWSFYGERCVVYLFGTRAILPFRVLWVLAIPIGAGTDLGLIWLIADTLNAFMAIPNLIALLLLSPVVFALSRDYFFCAQQDRSVGRLIFHVGPISSAFGHSNILASAI